MIIGPFEIVKHIGDGGMGVVYIAVDTRDARRVALKTVPLHPEDALQMEQRGARLLELFCRDSRRVPRAFDYGLLDECFYISMEHLDGENLSELIRRGPVPIARVFEIGRELCFFLEEAHSFQTSDGGKDYQSLVHGDFTPRNIRLTSTGIKVFDFGTSKALLRGHKTQRVYGTFPYLPPELLGAHPHAVDAYVDLWACVVVLYEMASGRLPFPGKTEEQIRRQIASGPPPLGKPCPQALWAIIRKGLAPAREERYENAQALREDLQAVLAGRASHAERDGWGASVADEDKTRRTDPIPDTPPTQRTTPPSGSGTPPGSADAHTSSAFRELRQPATMLGRWWRRAGAVALVFVLLLGNEIAVARDGSALAGDVSRYTLADLGDSWSKYEQLSGRSYLGFGTVTLRNALTRQTQAASDAVIAEYRDSTSIVWSPRWTLVRDALARAAAANPGDVNLRAALRYCEGHLHRIEGEARKREGKEAAAQQALTAAVSEFRAAAELRTRWPDPFLGLFRTFVIGLRDVDRGLDALRRAEELGLTRGRRESAQLAQGYEERGGSLEASARGVRAIAPVRDALMRAAQAYGDAVALYESIPDYGNAMSRIDILRSRIDRINERLAALSE